MDARRRDNLLYAFLSCQMVSCNLNAYLLQVNTTYGSISRTVQYLSDIPPHPTTSQFTIQVPTTHSEIVSRFRQHVQSIPKVQGKKIVAVIDSIVSVPGVLMPWKEMVKICKEEGVWSVVDGAHSIGQEPNINMKEADPDFWVSVNSSTFSRLASKAHRGDFVELS